MHVVAQSTVHVQTQQMLASFPPLTPTKNKKKRGGAWYRFAHDITAGQCHSNNYKQLLTLLLLEQVSCDCIGET